MNDAFGIAIEQPKSAEARQQVASQCVGQLQIGCPMAVDLIDNAVCEAYSAFPDRLYLLDAQGIVIYKGGRGPFGYHPDELEQALILELEAGGQHDEPHP